jgi:DNA-binding response OmpR family regulator
VSSSLRILVIEDDPRMLQLLRKGLWERGHLVVTASDGLEGLQVGKKHEFDVIILDIGLPQLDGHQVAIRLRAADCRAPLLMLTAMDLEDDIIRGLDLGADAYMTKPFSFRELLARIDALARRQKTAAATEQQPGSLTIDAVQRKVFHCGRWITLTRCEFLLLEQLAQRPGSVLSREALAEKIWGNAGPSSRSVLDNLINSLRSKLDTALQGSVIKTIRGLGYSLQTGSDLTQKQST